MMGLLYLGILLFKYCRFIISRHLFAAFSADPDIRLDAQISSNIVPMYQGFRKGKVVYWYFNIVRQV